MADEGTPNPEPQKTGGPPPIPRNLQPRNIVPPPSAQSRSKPPAMPVWAIVLIVCGVLAIPTLAIMAGLLLPALARAKQKAVAINCMSNLKQVGLAFRLWEGDHGDQFQFNVSTNKGGTLELCSPGTDGFDQNAWVHFQVMSNELSNPRILACPGDTTKQAATDFIHLNALNVTYLVHSGTNIDDAHPQTVLAICPIHRNVLYADGSVQRVSAQQMRKIMESVAQPQ
jgi:prepilin-type processing-associated H-X9-DG protein